MKENFYEEQRKEKISKKKRRELYKKLKNYTNVQLKELIINLTPFNDAKFEYIKKRDNYSCRFCGRKSELEVHHITPKSLGGDNHEWNLITLCHWCHLFLHANPMSRINSSELIKSKMVKINGKTFSTNGKAWGSPPLPKKTIKEIIELKKTKPTMSIREIANSIHYWNHNHKKVKVSKSMVHKIIKTNFKDKQ